MRASREAVRRAAVIIEEFSRGAHPKPAQSMHAMVLAVASLLDVGWTPAQLLAALPEASNVSVGALTFTLNQHKRATSGGREVISSTDADAIVVLVEAAHHVLNMAPEMPLSTVDAFHKLADALDGIDALYVRLLAAQDERSVRRSP